MNRVLQYPLARILIAVVLIVIAITIGQLILNVLRGAFSVTNTGLANLLAFVLLTPIAYLAYWLYVRYIEKRQLTELDRAHAAREFCLGSLVGFGLFSLVITLLGLFGLYHLTGVDFVTLSLVGALSGAFVSAFVQELIFRAAIFRITEEWLGTWWAIGVSALLFGSIHLSSSGATTFSTIAIALQGGVILTAAYTLTHRLWMALGLHMAWDFANDGIFGVGVAGQTGQALHGLFRASLTGPDLLTGGAFGVEASTITLVIVLIAGILILRVAYQKGQFVSGKNKSQRAPAQSVTGKISM